MGVPFTLPQQIVVDMSFLDVTKSIKPVFPPSPPLTERGEWDASSISSDGDGGNIPSLPVSVVVKEILPVDLNSPDKHVARDPRLIRLTGNHPFNSEAPLTELFEAGMYRFSRLQGLSVRISHAAGVVLRSESWCCTSSSR